MQTKTNRRLYLDDVRTPIHHEDWEVARDYNQLVSMIRLNGLDSYELISLDHDLGDTAMREYYNNVKDHYTLDYNNILEKTGYDVAKFLVAESMTKNIPLPQIYVHSANPIGSANIMGYVNNYLMNCGKPQTCIRVNIEHTIDESIQMTVEEREAKWKKKNNNNDDNTRVAF